MDLKIKMPEEVEEALKKLNEDGFIAYIVGGCVRDSILNVVPKDWDITTSALPEQIIQCFRNFKTIETGLKHGTVTVIINNRQLEITTFRIDGEYKDNRRPDQVFFTNNISLDLRRRDFTINAMAYNYKEGIVDLNNGVEDINRKQIKCVGDPDKRFNEDGLRILRALRFASVLNFKIEEKTSESIHENKKMLKNISAERIKVEFDKLILGDNFYNILKDYRDVVEIFIPEISKINEKTYEHSLNIMMNIQDDLVLKLSMFLHAINNSNCHEENEENKLNYETAKNILINLKYDNKTIDEVSTIILYLNSNITTDKKHIKKWLNKLGENSFKKLLKAKKLHNCPQKLMNPVDNVDNFVDNLEKVVQIVDNLITNNECYNLKTLKINGQDLKNIGIKQGKQIGDILKKLLELVVDEQLQNDKEILIEYVKSNVMGCLL